MGGEVQLGDYRLIDTGDQRPVIGESTTAVSDLRGIARVYSVDGPGWSLLLGDHAWENDERDLHVLDRGDAPQRFDRLRTRCRMSVFRRNGVLWCELAQARLGRDEIPSPRKADLEQLDATIGDDASARELLMPLGAFGVGTREDIFDETHNRRGFVCATFPPSAKLVAPAAYVISRIAPVARGVSI